MYEIDLLKGKGLPAQDVYRRTCVLGLGILLPLLVLVAMLFYGLHCKAAIDMKRTMLEEYKDRLASMQSSINDIQQVYQANNDLEKMSEEVAQFLEWQTQWTDILAFITDVWPEGFLLDGLEVRVLNQNIQVPSRFDDDKQVTITVPVRTLSIEMHTVSENFGDDVVKVFQNNLINEKRLIQIKDVVLRSREPQEIGGRLVVVYKMDIILYDQE